MYILRLTYTQIFKRTRKARTTMKAKNLDFADFSFDHRALLNRAEMLQCYYSTSLKDDFGLLCKISACHHATCHVYLEAYIHADF
jgi:hypothetical protein